MIKLVLKIIGIIFLAIVGLMLLGILIQILHTVFVLAIGIAMLFGFFYLIKYLFQLSSTPQPAKVSYKVFDSVQPAVALFLEKPTVKELVNAQNMSHVTQWAVDGSVFELDNNTQVIVLDDDREKEAIKVRVSEGKFRGREGWVCRSALCQTEARLLEG